MKTTTTPAAGLASVTPYLNGNDYFRSSTPLVMACGYRHVHIAKSGLSFPAWLVCIPHDNNPSHPPRFLWRSKRDFLRLARNKGATFPKAAWNKLCQAAPWKRPNFVDCTRTHHSSELAAPADFDPRTLLQAPNQWKPVMTKGLLQLDQYLQRVAALEGAREAWDEFVNVPFDYGQNHHRQAIGNALGQYFCHPTNAKQLVQTALERFQLAHDSQHQAMTETKRVVFIEPSCGHGQIIESLLEVLQSSTYPSQIHTNCQVQGIDIDPIAIEQCIEKFLQDANVSLSCRNFLETEVSNVTDDTDNVNRIVIVIGGPPYTAGAGSSSDDEASLCRDLPMQFVRRAVEAYSAAVICFLMPARCAGMDYVGDGWIPSSPRYEYETISLKAPSLFYFQGNEPVKQPSVIQCFWRVDPYDSR